MTGKSGLKGRESKQLGFFESERSFNGERFVLHSTHKKQRRAQDEVRRLRAGTMRMIGKHRTRTIIDREHGGSPVYKVYGKKVK